MPRGSLPYYGDQTEETVQTLIDTTVGKIFTELEEIEGHKRFVSGCASKSIKDVDDLRESTDHELKTIAQSAYGEDRWRAILRKILKFAGQEGEPHIPNPADRLATTTLMLTTPPAISVGRRGAGPRDNSPQFPDAFRTSESRSHLTSNDLKLSNMDPELSLHLKHACKNYNEDRTMGANTVKQLANHYSEVVVNHLGVSPATAVHESIKTFSSEFDKAVPRELRTAKTKTTTIMADSVGRFRRSVDSSNLKSKGRVITLKVDLHAPPPPPPTTTRRAPPLPHVQWDSWWYALSGGDLPRGPLHTTAPYHASCVS